MRSTRSTLPTLSFGGFAYGVKTAIDAQQAAYNGDGSLLYQYDMRVSTPKFSYYNFNGRFDYQHKTMLDGEVLTLSYLLSTTRSHQNTMNEILNPVNSPVDYTAYGNDNTEKFLEQTGQIDYVRPFGKTFKFETGAKYIYRSNKSDAFMDYTGGSLADYRTLFNHNTQVAAAYVEGIYHKDKLSARAGLRYEYSRLKAEYPEDSQKDYHKNLSDWIPSASVQYQFDDANSLKFSYSTNINRPGISYLNPAVNNSPTSISYGIQP